MARLKELVYSDVARHLELEGKSHLRPNFWRFLVHLPHYNFLPGFFYRLSRASFLAGIPLVPYIFTYLNVVLFGLEITPKCEIGPGLFFPHPFGTVIGASRIGDGVTLYQGVTLGAKNVTLQLDPSQRPVVGDRVILGAGCKVLGGIHIGNGVTVGANSVVLQSVPPETTVVGVPAKVIFPSTSTSEATETVTSDHPELTTDC